MAFLDKWDVVGIGVGWHLPLSAQGSWESIEK
jgi:hypothetical protein